MCFNQEHWIDVQRTKSNGFNILIFDIIRPKMSVRLVCICIYIGFPFNQSSFISKMWMLLLRWPLMKLALSEYSFIRLFKFDETTNAIAIIESWIKISWPMPMLFPRALILVLQLGSFEENKLDKVIWFKRKRLNDAFSDIYWDTKNFIWKQSQKNTT